MHRPVELVVVDDGPSLAQLLREGRIDLAALSAATYVQAVQDRQALRLLARPVASTGELCTDGRTESAQRGPKCNVLEWRRCHDLVEMLTY